MKIEKLKDYNDKNSCFFIAKKNNNQNLKKGKLMRYFLCCLLCSIVLIFLITRIPFNDKYTTSIFGFIGVITGAIISIIGNLIQEWYKNKDKKELEDKRKRLLLQMLNNPKFEWRDINTLSNVIGATKDETRRLLININARSSEKRDNGKELWALIKKQPLPDKE
jgi:hypothetical protein